MLRTIRPIHSVYAAGVALVLGSVFLVGTGPVGAIAAVAVVAVIVAIAWLGPERVGFGFLGLVFFTAPFYKGLVDTRSPATPTDGFLVVAVILLLPRLVAGRNGFAPPYLFGVLLVAVTGVIASMASIFPTLSLVTLAQWLILIIVIPIILVSLSMDNATIDRLAWAFIGGQILSTAYALADGAAFAGQYEGLTQHPNAFAQSGMFAFALLLHLITRTRRSWLVWGAIAICLFSVYLSGGRAGTVTVALLILLIPLVERSALVTYAITFVGVVALLVLTALISKGEAGGSLYRLAGGGSASGSDTIRAHNLDDALVQFWHHPLLGSGLVGDYGLIHNNFAEVAVTIGALGLIGYLVIMWTLGRSLLGRSDMRRLSYVVVGYVAYGMTIPSLTDRSVWLVLGLSAAVFRGFSEPPVDARPDNDPLTAPPDSASKPGALPLSPVPRGSAPR